MGAAICAIWRRRTSFTSPKRMRSGTEINGAYVAALTFLDMNGVSIARPVRALEDATVAVAKNEIGKEGLAKILRALASRDD